MGIPREHNRSLLQIHLITKAVLNRSTIRTTRRFTTRIRGISISSTTPESIAVYSSTPRKRRSFPTFSYRRSKPTKEARNEQAPSTEDVSTRFLDTSPLLLNLFELLLCSESEIVYNVTASGEDVPHTKCSISIRNKQGREILFEPGCSGKFVIENATLWWPHTHSADPG